MVDADRRRTGAGSVRVPGPRAGSSAFEALLAPERLPLRRWDAGANRIKRRGPLARRDGSGCPARGTAMASLAVIEKADRAGLTRVSACFFPRFAAFSRKPLGPPSFFFSKKSVGAWCFRRDSPRSPGAKCAESARAAVVVLSRRTCRRLWLRAAAEAEAAGRRQRPD